ncbi:MAG: methyltransferase domain-containing protein, partial [Xanthomonadales bacterium]|nr:methyltransferase domain-containing protein [Xanthomonadales bacterium]
MKDFSFLEPARRSFRNWQRKRTRIRPSQLPSPFSHAKDIDAVHRYFSGFVDGRKPQVEPADTLAGVCYICDEDVHFSVNVPTDGAPVNWRETLTCPGCGLINRWRGCLHVFDAVCQPQQNDRIYLTETLSPVYQNLAARYPDLCASEFIPDAAPGESVEVHGVPVRNEDVTCLTFADASLDSVLCFDVLEHVPDYRSALKEFFRV